MNELWLLPLGALCLAAGAGAAYFSFWRGFNAGCLYTLRLAAKRNADLLARWREEQRP